MLSTDTIIPWTASPTKCSFLLLQRSYSAFTIHCTSVKEREFLDILYWFQKALLFLYRDPVPGKWVCRFSWNLRFSGFLNALGCGFYHDKFFFIRVYKDINVLAAVTFAVLPVRIKELVYGNVQQGDDLVKGIQVWLWGRYAVLCFSSILSTYSMTTLIDWKNGGKINADKIWDSIIDTYFSAILEKLEVEQCRRF